MHTKVAVTLTANLLYTTVMFCLSPTEFWLGSQRFFTVGVWRSTSCEQKFGKYCSDGVCKILR